MKKKIRIIKYEGITWRKEFVTTADGMKCIISTKIVGFRRKIDSPKSRGILN